MAAIPFPTSVAPGRVIVRPVWANAQFDNPIDLSVEVQSLGGFRFELDITMQPMPKDLAADFGAFIQAMAGGVGRFTFNVTPWAPGWSPAPGVRTFFLSTNNPSWDASVAQEFGYSFTAIEEI